MISMHLKSDVVSENKMTEFDVPLLGETKSKRKIRESNPYGSFTFRKFKIQYF
jgi:hypothetical protein